MRTHFRNSGANFDEKAYVTECHDQPWIDFERRSHGFVISKVHESVRCGYLEDKDGKGI